MNKLSELCAAIYTHLRDNPNDSAAVFSACSSGMNAALDKVQEYASECSTAMLSALILADSKRIAPEMRGTLFGLIAKACDRPNASPVEKKFAAEAVMFAKGDR